MNVATMWRVLKPILIVLAVLVGLAVLLVVAHEVIEARVFRRLADQPGLRITIGARVGNLFRGYDLRDVEITSTRKQGDAPPSVFRTPRLTVHWELRPFKVTRIAWDGGTLSLLPEGGGEEEIAIGEGSLVPDEAGKLVCEPIAIGPESWRGRLSLEIDPRARRLSGRIDIDRLPATIVRLMGTVPPEYEIPDVVTVAVNLSGVLPDIRASGAISNPLTRETYRF